MPKETSEESKADNETIMTELNPYYKAISSFRLRRYEECTEICNQLIASRDAIQGPWELKMSSMTARVMVDDIEAEDEVTGSIFFFNFNSIPSFVSIALLTRQNSDCIFVYCIQFYAVSCCFEMYNYYPFFLTIAHIFFFLCFALRDLFLPFAHYSNALFFLHAVNIFLTVFLKYFSIYKR